MVVFVLDEELLVDDDVFVGVVAVFELDVFAVLELLDVLDVLAVVFSLFVSLIFISTAKTFVVKNNNKRNKTFYRSVLKRYLERGQAIDGK